MGNPITRRAGGLRKACLLLLLFMSAAVLPAEEVTLPFGGLTVNANLEIAEGRDIADGVVLIVHGTTGHNRMELIESSQRILRDNAINSLAINLGLGRDNRHGRFDCTWPHRHLQQDAIDQLSLWIDWLRRQGATRIALLGHSRGANQVMVYAVDHRDPGVTHLVMLAPGQDDVRSNYEERYGPVFDANIKRMKERVALNRADELVSNVDFWSCPKASVTAASFLSYYGDDSRFRQFHAYLPKIPIPTLIIVGTHDELFPDSGSLIGSHVDNRRLFLSEIEDAGHFFRDFNIDEAMEAMIAFLGWED